MPKLIGQEPKRHDLYARVEPDLYERLVELARRNERTVSAEVRRAVRQYVERENGGKP